MRLEVIDIGALVRNWWTLTLRGVAGILFGLLALFVPGISLALLLFLFGVYALVDGALLLVSVLRSPSNSARPWWLLLLQGVLGITVGVGTFMAPVVTAFALIYLIAGWMLATGVLEVVAAVRMRKAIENEWMLIAHGVLAAAMGLLFVLWPGAGALVLVVWIGGYAAVNGVMLIAASIRLRRWGRTHRDADLIALHPAPG